MQFGQIIFIRATKLQTQQPASHIRAKYYAYPGAQIKVLSGNTLTMIEADVIGCDQM